MAAPWTVKALLRTAGILQYSKPLYDEIEQHMLKLYAAAFVPALEGAIEDSEAQVEQVLDLAEAMQVALEDFKDRSTYQNLERLAMALAPIGGLQALAQFGFNFGALQQALRRGNARALDQGEQAAQLLIDSFREQASKILTTQAEEMKQDIKVWKSKVSDEERERIHKAFMAGDKDALDLTIKLKPEHFPFLGKKFEGHVKKQRGEDAGMFDDMPEIHVKLRQLGAPGMVGAWDAGKDTLMVAVPPFAKSKGVIKQLKETIAHELRHTSQTVMAKALGVNTMLTDKDGNLLPARTVGPGGPPRRLNNPEIIQGLRYDINPEITQRRQEIMARHGIQDPDALYSLDDIEFYTHLADRVLQFEDHLKVARDTLGFNAKEQRLMMDLFTGGIEVPKHVKEALENRRPMAGAAEWLQKHDPGLRVFAFVRPIADSFFRIAKDHDPERWKKAVKEFTKVVEPKLDKGEGTGGVKKLWEQFLAEKYEGGKATVTNPNPKTKDSHPEITVNYLLSQTDPAYQAHRQRLRREFAAWRAQKLGRPAKPKAPKPKKKAPPRAKAPKKKTKAEKPEAPKSLDFDLFAPIPD